MPKICYIAKKFGADRMAKIDAANKIIAEYWAQGYELTLRQLYYQFVSRDLIPNTQRDYKNLGDIINDARLASNLHSKLYLCWKDDEPAMDQVFTGSWNLVAPSYLEIMTALPLEAHKPALAYYRQVWAQGHPAKYL